MSSRENTTRYVVLGMLDIVGNLSGYDIRRWISETISFFWAESFGQIYPELARLESAKMIAAVRAKPQAGRGRRVFRITALGRRELRAWLQQPAPPERLRIDYLLKLVFGSETAAETNRNHILAVSRRQSGRAEVFRGFRNALEKEDVDDPNFVHWAIVLRHGQLLAAARLRWAEESLALIDAHAAGGNRSVLAALKRQERKRR